MIEILDSEPDVSVQPAEYKRLLGYPRDWVVSGRALELTEWARDWYAQHGRPWVYAREAERIATTNGEVSIDGVRFTSRRLQATLDSAQADRLFLAAVSAGPELEQMAQQLWRAEKPDEYFFLEVYGSAVVEHLITIEGARLCAWADSQNLAVLPHYSPGYGDWEIAEQPQLLQLIGRARERSVPFPLDVLPSGMLRPKKSLLAVFGVTAHTQDVLHLSELIPCQSCSFSPCQYRRTEYRRALPITTELVPQAASVAENSSSHSTVLDLQAKYVVNRKALARWSSERLALSEQASGDIEAHFRFDGTTCSNMGRRLAFDYRVTLGPRSAGYPIRHQWCGPAAGDEGHLAMCNFLDDPRELARALDRDRPLLGQPLNDVLSWNSPTLAANCFCEEADRLHKWRLVLETIHFALAEREIQPATLGS
jgi:hypothetical protein